ncbi:JKAMP-like protein [Mya arenaria]|uniref:JKAMP-like protein n=1 Tax=Mya arenaria TaxID=6604 RepID=A0ABY7F8A7_MYAAR|nr:JNK1/MAPK8-associated membrane protein-like [Mya arenaria]WAR18440.1 JKAMP-like protein [Mya arenaria]
MLKLIFLLYFFGVSTAEIAVQPEECPGLYCGRKPIGPAHYSDCGACPRGHYVENSICGECDASPTLYDWLYLGFMAQVSLLLHFFCIEIKDGKKSSQKVLHLSALTESVTAALLTLLLSEPRGSLSLTSCHVNRLEDWYSMLYNPSPNYTYTLHCTQEIVYPLYTIVMIYYAFSLLFMLCLRPIISYKFVECRGKWSIYAALYFLPILIVIQALFAGLLYYSFPYITIIVSLITSAIYMASSPYTTSLAMIREKLLNVRGVVVLLGHLMLHAYGIIAITELKEPEHGPLLLLVVCPMLFYIFTNKFTNPDNLDRVE